MLAYDAAERAAADVTNRTVMAQNAAGRHIVCTDSIAFALPEDIDNVLVTAGHTGRSAVPYLLKARPYGFICSDGGMARDRSGVLGLDAANEAGLPGATVAAGSAAMGDGLGGYSDVAMRTCTAVAAAARGGVGRRAGVAGQH